MASSSSLKAAVEASPDEATLLWAHDALKSVKTPTRGDRRLLAEVSFMLARIYKRRADKEKATAFGEEAIELFQSLNIKTKEEALPLLKSLLVDYVHEGTVKAEIFG